MQPYEELRLKLPEGLAEAFEKKTGVPAETAEEALVWVHSGNGMHAPNDINDCFQNARAACRNKGISYETVQDFVRAYVPGQAFP